VLLLRDWHCPAEDYLVFHTIPNTGRARLRLGELHKLTPPAASRCSTVEIAPRSYMTITVWCDVLP